MANYIYNAHVDEATNKIDFIEQILNDEFLVSIERAEGVIEITDAVLAAGFSDTEDFMNEWSQSDHYLINGSISTK